MTRFTVTWFKGAQNHLAEIWLDAPDRQAIADAANAIDRELATDADSKGVPVSEGLRSLHVPPLHVLFAVREPDRVVEVVAVRADRPPSLPSEGNGEAQAPSSQS